MLLAELDTGIQNCQLDTSDTSDSHHHQLLDCEDEGNQTVSEILSLLSANSTEEPRATVQHDHPSEIYQRSKVLTAPKASEVPLL